MDKLAVNKKYRIAIADDQRAILDSVQMFINMTDDIEVALGTDNFDDLLDGLRQVGHVDLILLDLAMPGLQDYHDILRVAELKVGPFAIFSGNTDREISERCMAMGAVGILHKTMPMDAVVSAIRMMVNGVGFVPTSFPKKIPTAWMRGTTIPGEETLTGREREVLYYLLDDKSNKEIGLLMDLAEITVKLHVRNLLRKFGVENRRQLIRKVQHASET